MDFDLDFLNRPVLSHRYGDLCDEKSWHHIGQAQTCMVINIESSSRYNLHTAQISLLVLFSLFLVRLPRC